MADTQIKSRVIRRWMIGDILSIPRHWSGFTYSMSTPDSDVLCPSSSSFAFVFYNVYLQTVSLSSEYLINVSLLSHVHIQSSISADR